MYVTEVKTSCFSKGVGNGLCLLERARHHEYLLGIRETLASVLCNWWIYKDSTERAAGAEAQSKSESSQLVLSSKKYLEHSNAPIFMKMRLKTRNRQFRGKGQVKSIGWLHAIQQNFIHGMKYPTINATLEQNLCYMTYDRDRRSSRQDYYHMLTGLPLPVCVLVAVWYQCTFLQGLVLIFYTHRQILSPSCQGALRWGRASREENVSMIVTVHWSSSSQLLFPREWLLDLERYFLSTIRTNWVCSCEIPYNGHVFQTE